MGMVQFSYKAVSPEGKLIEGTIEALDEGSALSQLKEQGQLPIDVQSDSGLFSRDLVLPWKRRRVGQGDLLLFTGELASLLQAGLALDRSLTILAQLTENEYLEGVILNVLGDIKAGKSLSDAISAHPDVFPKVYASMVRAGEAGGSLDVILARVSEYLASAEELKNYLKTALIYPAILVVVLGTALVFLFSFVVPRFADIFENAGAPVPLPMQIMLGISGFMTSYWWVLLLIIAASVYGIRRRLSTPAGRLSWDEYLLKLPLLGAILQKLEVSRFSRSLGTLLTSAVPLLHSISIVKDIVSNQAIASAMEPIKSGVKKGEGLVKPIRDSGIFPPFALHLLQVGEETGRLDTVLLQIANTYDRELRISFQRFVAYFEPAIIVTMGLAVGVVVVSIFYSILSINDIPI